MAPEMSWDAMNYQLQLPKCYFREHGFYSVTGLFPYHYPGFVQMLFSLGLLWGNDSLARSFSFLGHIGAAISLVVIGKKLGNEKAGYISAIIYWAFPFLNILSTRGYVDLISGFYGILGLGIFLAQGNSKQIKEVTNGNKICNPECFIALISLSVLWGMKYNAVAYWMAGLLILVSYIIDHKLIKIPKWFWLCCFIFPFLFYLPWGLKNYFYTRNPFFPYFAKLISTFDWNNFDQKAYSIKFHIEGLKGLLKLPSLIWNIFFDHYGGAPNEDISLCFLIFAPLIYEKRVFENWQKAAWIGFTTPVFLWLVTSHQLRLIAPSIGLLALILGFSFVRVSSLDLVWRKKTTVVLTVLLWLNCFYLFQGLLNQPNPIPVCLGVKSKEQFLSEILQPKGYVQVADILNKELPKDSRIMILGQLNGYYIDRVSIFDFDYTYPVFKKWIDDSKTPENLYVNFKRNGYDYLLYNSNGMIGSAIRTDELGINRYQWSEEELHNYEKWFLKYTVKMPIPINNGYSLYKIIPREGCSSFPEFIPGTELIYLKSIQKLQGYSRLDAIVGKNISPEVYQQTYKNVSDEHPGLGYPLFQYSFALLSENANLIPRAMAYGLKGYKRNGDLSSWLTLQGDTALIQREYSCAEKLLKKAQEISPERDDVARNLALVYYCEHDYLRAVNEADMAVSLAPYSLDYQQTAEKIKAFSKNNR